MKTVTELAQQIADAELEACCALMDDWGLDAADLRAARRPQPQPSLKAQAIDALLSAGTQPASDFKQIDPARQAIILAALELVPEGPAVTPCRSRRTPMADLSPQARAVLDAWAASENGVYLEGDPERLSAALRAVERHIAKLLPNSDTTDTFDAGYECGLSHALDELVSIAKELKNFQ